MKIKKPANPGSRLRKFARFSGLGFQIGITIYLGAYAGKKLDAHYQTGKTFTAGLIILAFIYSVWSLVRELKTMNGKNDGKQ